MLGRIKTVIRDIALSKIARLIYFNVCLPVLRWLPFPSTIFGPVKGRHRSFTQWLANLRGTQEGLETEDTDKKHWILKIRPPRVTEETPPMLAIPQVPKEFARESIHKSPNIFLAHIYWGRIATAYFEVISPDDSVFDDFFFPPPQNEYPAQSLILPWIPRPQRKYGTYVTFANYRATVNYYHWVINCLTRLWVLHMNGRDDYRLIVPRKLLPFHKQTLELMGFSADRLAPFGDEHWFVEHLLVPSYTMAPRHVSLEACRWLKDKLISSVRNSQTLPRRIYISRSLAPKRRLINEHEIIKLLRRYGFTPVHCESMTVEEQINLFRSAEVVVALHGAGLTNILFMNEGSLVVELVPSRRAKPHFCNLSSAMGLKYVCLTDAPEGDDQLIEGRQPDVNFSVPIERLSMAIQSLGL